jgi:transketolase
MRDAFFATLLPELKKNRNLLVLSNDQGAPSLDRYREECPGQFINMAISEQNMISVAAGLALSGKKVFVYGIAPFVTLRCYEQIKIDLCTMRLPVCIVGVGCGYGYAVDGPTHHATEDLSAMRALAEMMILCPSDPRSVAILVPVTVAHPGPLYLRLDRESIALPVHPWVEGSVHGFSVLREGRDLSIIACGNMVARSLEVASRLEPQGIQAQVIDCYQVKPIGPRLAHRLAGIPRVVTLEEHTIHGGLGGAILELLAAQNQLVPVKCFGVGDEQLYAYGARRDLHWQRGLDAGTLARSIRLWIDGEEEIPEVEEAEPISKQVIQAGGRARPSARALPREDARVQA